MFSFWPHILDPFQIIRLKELKFSRSIIFNKNIFEMLTASNLLNLRRLFSLFSFFHLS